MPSKSGLPALGSKFIEQPQGGGESYGSDCCAEMQRVVDGVLPAHIGGFDILAVYQTDVGADGSSCQDEEQRTCYEIPAKTQIHPTEIGAQPSAQTDTHEIYIGVYIHVPRVPDHGVKY